MSDLTFKSGLAPYMIGLIKQRQAIGYKYGMQIDMLIRFDEFCAEFFLTKLQSQRLCLTSGRRKNLMKLRGHYVTG